MPPTDAARLPPLLTDWPTYAQSLDWLERLHALLTSTGVWTIELQTALGHLGGAVLLAADNPAVIGKAFAADLPGAPAFADGMDQLDALGVDDPEHRRGSHESIGPRLMGHEEAKEPGPLR
jgi:hypothetical protein